MMLKKLIFFFIIIILTINNCFAKIEIVKKIDNEIITNYDINKEANYLKLLNPEINKLNFDQVNKLAEISLITEIVKKKELSKFIDLNQSNSISQKLIEDLYKKLNYKNQSEFEIQLKKAKLYNLDEIKKKFDIEILWNDLIYSKFSNQVKINKYNLEKKILNSQNTKQKQYKLSEILFEKKINQDLNEIITEIKTSIKDIGFNNTASIYSISESSKKGGKLDWVSENSLSEIINRKLSKLKINENTEPIQVGNNFIMLKIDDIKTSEIKLDKEKELQKLIKIETNKQLNRFSRIYFNRIKINYSIK